MPVKHGDVSAPALNADVHPVAHEVGHTASDLRAHAQRPALRESRSWRTMLHMELGENNGPDLIARLRAADEATVEAALRDSYIDLPRDHLLEFWNRMLDQVLGEDQSPHL